MITSDQILKLQKQFAAEAITYSEYLINLINFPNGLRFVGNLTLDRIDSNTIKLYWDICNNYIIIAIQKIDIGFNTKILARFTIGAKFPQELDIIYIKYKLEYEKFVQMVVNVIEKPIKRLELVVP